MATWKRIEALDLSVRVVKTLKEAGIKTDAALRKWISDPERERIKGIGERAEAQIRQALALEVVEAPEAAELEEESISPEEEVELGLAPSPTPEAEAEEILEVTPEDVEAVATPEVVVTPEEVEAAEEPEVVVTPEEVETEEAEAAEAPEEVVITPEVEAAEPQPEPEAERPEEVEAVEAPHRPPTPPVPPEAPPPEEVRPEEEPEEARPNWWSRNWGWLNGAAISIAAIAAGLLFLWPGWAWTWNPRPPQIVEVIKEVPVEVEVIKEVPVEKVVKETVVVEKPVEKVVEKVITATPMATPTVVPSPTPDQRVEQLAQDVRDLAAAFAGLTNIVSQTISAQVQAAPAVQVAEPITSPVLFDGQSTGKEYRATYDIGVNSGQVGIVFGYSVEWSGHRSGEQGCGLIWLQPGWYPTFRITDGRYEVYDLPATDPEGWIRVLVEQRAHEQAVNYRCPSKDFDDVPVWESMHPSPPIAPPTLTPTVTPGPTPTPTATTVARQRRVTGQNKSLTFQVGDSVYGWRIRLADGRECDGGECWLPKAPGPGTVTSGVINPWPDEVPAATKANPWKP